MSQNLSKTLMYKQEYTNVNSFNDLPGYTPEDIAYILMEIVGKGIDKNEFTIPLFEKDRIYQETEFPVNFQGVLKNTRMDLLMAIKRAYELNPKHEVIMKFYNKYFHG